MKSKKLSCIDCYACGSFDFSNGKITRVSCFFHGVRAGDFPCEKHSTRKPVREIAEKGKEA